MINLTQAFAVAFLTVVGMAVIVSGLRHQRSRDQAQFDAEERRRHVKLNPDDPADGDVDD